MIGLDDARICTWGQIHQFCGLGLEIDLSYSYVIGWSGLLMGCVLSYVISEIVIRQARVDPYTRMKDHVRVFT